MKLFWKRALLTFGAVTLAAGAWTAYQWYDIQRTWQRAVPAKRCLHFRWSVVDR